MASVCSEGPIRFKKICLNKFPYLFGLCLCLGIFIIK